MPTKPWGVQNEGGNAPPSAATLNALVARIGSTPGWVGWARNFTGANYVFNATDFTTVIKWGAIPVLTWTPNDGTGALHLSNANIMSGTYDAYIDSYASGLKALDSTVIIRFGHEANGSWYDWSPGLNGNTASSYIAMWRYVRARFNALNVTNVKWCWCMNVHGFGEATSDWTTIYPGDAYVDYVSCDGYNYGEASPHTWFNFLTVFNTSFTDLLAAAPTKTLYINEMGSVESIRPYVHSKAQWIQDALYQINIDSRIAFFMYLDYFWPAGDMRLNTSVDAQNAFASAVGTATGFSSLSAHV